MLKAHMNYVDSIVDIGVDYITATCKDSDRAETFNDLGQRLVAIESCKGNKLSAWGMKGYKGFAAGSAQCASKEGIQLVRLSGGLARDNWRELYDLSTNVSRLDLQMTVRMRTDPQPMLLELYAALLEGKTQRGRKPECGINHSSKGGATVSSGSRRGDVYRRTYDKGRESGRSDLHYCVRYEAELKDAPAKLAAFNVRRGSSETLAVAGLLSQIMAEVGIVLPARGPSEYNVRCAQSPSDVARSLRWLQTSVKGAVSFLVSRGMLDEVLDALGLEAKVVTRARLARTISANKRRH